MSLRFRELPRPARRHSAQRARRGRSYWRAVLFVAAVAVLALGGFIWHTASEVSQLDQPEVGVEPIINGMFLGVLIDDDTDDKFSSNAWLRLAMNTGHQAATPARRYQISDISVKDGQHPDTGEAAAIVILTPRAQEFPLPPFEPVAVRRWQPPADIYYSREKIAELQRIRPPNQDDLDRLAEVWCGKRIGEAESLIRSMYRLLLFTLIGIGFILLAGAYRSYQWLATRWDSFADQQASGHAVQQLRHLRSERQSREGVDA